MNAWTISRTVLFSFLLSTMAAAADKTPPSYEKGKISNVSGNHSSCELEGVGLRKLISNCGELQAGQTVDYRVKGDKVYIRREGGKEYKCGIVGTIESSAAGGKLAYQQGTIKGWEKGTDFYWGGFRGEPIPRDKTVYELKGAEMVYLIDYCGSFEAGKFSLGQTVNFRVDETDKDNRRLYISHDKGEEYNCKIEGQKMLDHDKSAVPLTAPGSTDRNLNP